MKEKSREINKQIEFGLETIDPDRKVEIKLKDLIYIYKTFEEFNRFFHQPMHYSTMQDINIYLGDKDNGAYSIISKMYYDILSKYVPKEIIDKWGDENCPFSIDEYPYYYKIKNDENIDDGTIDIKDKETFINFVKVLKSDYKNNNKQWSANNIDDFIENIISYTKDIDGYYKNMNFETSPKIPTWRIFAQILKGATIYE